MQVTQNYTIVITGQQKHQIEFAIEARINELMCRLEKSENDESIAYLKGAIDALKAIEGLLFLDGSK